LVPEVIAEQRATARTAVFKTSLIEPFSEKTSDSESEIENSGTTMIDPELRSTNFLQQSSNCNETQPNQGIKIRDVFPLFSGDQSLADIEPISDQSQNYGIQVSVDYDAFRGVPDGSWENNGLRTGFNYATRLGSFSDATGIGMQIGGSVGVYDWAGTEYRLQNTNRAETQGFLTYGLYRKPIEGSRLVAGVVQDWSFNDTYGVYGQSPTMSQLRAQLGYAVSASNEFGVMGTDHPKCRCHHVANDQSTQCLLAPQMVCRRSGHLVEHWCSLNGPTGGRR
jgi:hypothetical protein